MGDPILQLDEAKIEEIVTWLRDNYEGIRQACEDKNLPKPPRW